MATRSRIFTFGSAAALVLAGVVVTALVSGLAARIAGAALITVGLGGAILLVFLEVGLSEDREHARDDARRRSRDEHSVRTHRRR